MNSRMTSPHTVEGTGRAPTVFQQAEHCVDAIIEKVGKRIVLGLPLGLGKAPQLANALYQRAKQDPGISLKIITAISLEMPQGKSLLERRFMGPFAERLFGKYPSLDYVADLRRDQLPANVTVAEFYFKPASFLNHPAAQSNYICTNYTHAARDLIAQGINVIAQIIAKPEQDPGDRYSLSCNPDMTLDLVPMMREQARQGQPVAVIGQVNNHLPYMVHDAEQSADMFDFILDNPALEFPLFSTPNLSISATDHLIGFHASTLLKDGGTLQIGIGSLGDALINSTLMRHLRNADYQALCDELQLSDKFPVIDQLGERTPFEQGLYGDTEMLVHGYMSLYKAGVLKRQVYDHLAIQRLVNRGVLKDKVSLDAIEALFEERAIDYRLGAEDVALLRHFGLFKDEVSYQSGQLLVNGLVFSADLSAADYRQLVLKHCLGDRLKNGIVAHGAFFLGPESFYQALRELNNEQRQQFNMTAVSYTNDLYGNQALKTAQRQQARFINTCMMYTLSGGAVSDGLDNGQVVSGVGGQYNFVSMAHELPDARSILMLRSTRSKNGKVQSNIVTNYGHITIPRHLRDLVVTEYGVADLRGKSDQAVIDELLKVTDSRFQDELIATAKRTGKLAADYQLPLPYRNNTPARLKQIMARYTQRGCFAPFPFGHDFHEDELILGKALKSLKLKSANKRRLLASLLRGVMIKGIPEHLEPLVQRMALAQAGNWREWLYQRLLVVELLDQLPPLSAKHAKTV